MKSSSFIVAIALLSSLFAGFAFSQEPKDAEPKNAAELRIEDFFRQAAFQSMSLSPDGKHVAISIELEDRSAFAVLDLSSMTRVMSTQLQKGEYIARASWVSNTRIVWEMGKRFPLLEEPLPTGELMAVDFDGKRSKYLFGYRGAMATGSRVTKNVARRAAASLLSSRLSDDRYIVVAVKGFGASEGSAPELCRLDVYSGSSQCDRSLPVGGILEAALLDQQNKVRAVSLINAKAISQTFYRSEDGEWNKIELPPGENLYPIAWVGQGEQFYAQHSKAAGPIGLSKVDPSTGKVEHVYASASGNVGDPLFDASGQTPFAVKLTTGRGGFKPLKVGPELTALREVAAAFPGETAAPVMFSSDGKRALVEVYSDVSMTRYYFYDLEGKKLNPLGSARDWLAPDWMAPTEVLSVTASDGLTLEALLTLPKNASEKNPVPVILMPHGGPFGVRDDWGFNSTVQLLASRGYGVLRVNFRGSSGFGKAFEQAGYKQWGKKMQTDLTAAVDEVVKRKEVDADRLAVYGASYGGYAALMAGATEADRYKAVVSFVGVTDLKLMYTRGDMEDSLFSVNFLKRTLGTENLAQISPVNLADKIKAPVFLIHGLQDERVPIVHAERMRAALKAANNEPEWYVEDKEGHGFYLAENQVKLYTRLLAFFDKHLKR